MFTSKTRTIAILFCLQVLSNIHFSTASSVSTNANEENTEDDDELVQFVNLQDLNNTELENICTSRGFELIPEVDPNTGEPLEFTHDDYVEAAQQCLDVETEM